MELCLPYLIIMISRKVPGTVRSFRAKHKFHRTIQNDFLRSYCAVRVRTVQYDIFLRIIYLVTNWIMLLYYYISNCDTYVVSHGAKHIYPFIPKDLKLNVIIFSIIYIPFIFFWFHSLNQTPQYDDDGIGIHIFINSEGSINILLLQRISVQ